jgi:hypothetical protein
MSATLQAIVPPLLVTSKLAVGATLTYFGAAMRKAFLVVFGSAVMLMAAAHFIDVTWTAGHEADIVVSLAVSLLFAFSILLVTGAVKEQPIFNVAILVALLGSFYAAMAGVHNSAALYEIFDASTSAVVVFALGIIVALQSASKRPVLAASLALATVGYTALQVTYFRLQELPHYNEVLGAMTVAYAALIGSAYVLPRKKGMLPTEFEPANVFKAIQTAVGAGLEGTVGLLARLVGRT